MMLRAVSRLLHLFAFAACLSASPSWSATSLQHDIFQRPPLEALKSGAPEPVKTVTPAPPPPEWKPELRAIIQGGGSAMVNVEGRILQIGQDMDGYRLVEVQERRATFVKDKVRYTLNLGEVKGAAAAAPAAPSAPPAAPAASQPAPGSAAPAATPALPPAPSAPAVTPAPGGLGSVKTSDVILRGTAPDARAAADGKPPTRSGG